MKDKKAYKIVKSMVVEAIKLHIGGPPFFTALDAMIKESSHFFGLMEVLFGYPGYKFKPNTFIPLNVVVSGQFGRMFANRCMQLNITFINLVIANGNIRRDVPIDDLTYLRGKIYGCNFIFLDDSYHCGKTRRAIKNALAKAGATMYNVYVVYDGSTQMDSHVRSLFRYYDWKAEQHASFY